jgi:uncharacterized protein
MSEQVVIDSLDFASKAEVLRGEVAVAKLTRLQDALYADEGTLVYVLSGGVNAYGKPVLHCEVKGELSLECQRCMGALKYVVEVSSDVLLAKDEVELASYDESTEVSTEAILADPHLDVLALVEDEVILALPMSPMHPLVECRAKPQLQGRESGPFAVLAALKASDNRGDS